MPAETSHLALELEGRKVQSFVGRFNKSWMSVCCMPRHICHLTWMQASMQASMLPLLGIDEACKSAEASLADDVGVHGWLELALYILSSIHFPMTNDFP